MTIIVKARYINGQLIPLEPLDLEEGAEAVENRKRQAETFSRMGV